jgi:hypothetical protein
MICKLQVVTLDEDGNKETREIACLKRTDLKPETLGLTLAEGKNDPERPSADRGRRSGGELSIAKAALS